MGVSTRVHGDWEPHSSITVRLIPSLRYSPTLLPIVPRERTHDSVARAPLCNHSFLIAANGGVGGLTDSAINRYRFCESSVNTLCLLSFLGVSVRERVLLFQESNSIGKGCRLSFVLGAADRSGSWCKNCWCELYRISPELEAALLRELNYYLFTLSISSPFALAIFDFLSLEQSHSTCATKFTISLT